MMVKGNNVAGLPPRRFALFSVRDETASSKMRVTIWTKMGRYLWSVKMKGGA